MVGTRKSLPSVALPDDIPPELRIDGKGTLLGEKRDEAPKRVYHWKGAVYEATADTPAEWLTQEPERRKPKRQRSPSPPAPTPTLPPAPPPPPRKKKKQTPPTTTTATKKRRKFTITTAMRAEDTVVFPTDMKGAADIRAEVEGKKEEARKNGYRVQGIQDDELRDNITVRPPGRGQDVERDDDTGIQLGQNIYAMGKLNSRIDIVKAKYDRLKRNGWSVDALRKRKRADGERGVEELMTSHGAKRARHDTPEDDDTTHIDGPLQIPTPAETDREYLGMTQLKEAANAAPPNDPPRETPDSQLRSPTSNLDTTLRRTADPSTPAEEAYTSPSELAPRRHASSVSMSISSGTSPSIHEAATAPATTTTNTTATTRSSRPNDHFGKQQPRIAPPDLAPKNRGGQTLRWSIKSEDIAKNPEGAESLIQKGRMHGESKQARRRRVAREMAFLKRVPSQEV